MVVAKLESNMESPQMGCAFSASHELASHKRGNIFLDVCGISDGFHCVFLLFVQDPGVAKMLLQCCLQLTLITQL